MSILIKGMFGKDMPMPQEGYVDIRIHFKNGKLKCVTMPTGEDPFYATFDVEKLPPHGRLGDLDKLIDDCTKCMNTLDPESREYARILMVKSYLMRATEDTVIEAEGSET